MVVFIHLNIVHQNTIVLDFRIYILCDFHNLIISNDMII